MMIRTLEVGTLRTNCYLVVSDGARKAADGGRPSASGRGLSASGRHSSAIIDPGDDPDLILGALEELDATVDVILLTHFHFDHIMAVPKLLRATGAPLAIHEADAALLANPPALFRFTGRDTPRLTADRLLHDGDEVVVGEVALRVLHTPGHSPGGVSFYAASEGAVFCGDTLFAGGVGRADFAGSNADQLMRSIRERLFALPDDTVVYPGHGPSTTIGHERRTNPWVGERFVMT